MSWSAAIANLLRAIALYFELKNRSFYYDVIERLRNGRNARDADDADLLRMQLLEEKQFYKHISAAYAATTSLSAN
jgi:cell division FtsZ-interacting protein ZapD